MPSKDVVNNISSLIYVLWVGGLNKFDYAEMQILQVAYSLLSTSILLTCPHGQLDLL